MPSRHRRAASPLLLLLLCAGRARAGETDPAVALGEARAALRARKAGTCLFHVRDAAEASLARWAAQVAERFPKAPAGWTAGEAPAQFSGQSLVGDLDVRLTREYRTPGRGPVELAVQIGGNPADPPHPAGTLAWMQHATEQVAARNRFFRVEDRTVHFFREDRLEPPAIARPLAGDATVAVIGSQKTTTEDLAVLWKALDLPALERAVEHGAADGDEPALLAAMIDAHEAGRPGRVVDGCVRLGGLLVPAIVEKQKALLPAAPPGWQVTGETVYGDHGIEFRSAEREFAKGAVRARVRFHPMPAAEAAGFRRALDAPAEPGAADLAGSFAGRPALLTGSGTIIVPLNRGGFQLWIGPPVGDPVPPRGWAKDFERALDLAAIEKALGALHE